MRLFVVGDGVLYGVVEFVYIVCVVVVYLGVDSIGCYFWGVFYFGI